MATMPLTRRRIKRARIKHISLVPRGANALQTIYKSAEGNGPGTVTFDALAKFDNEKGELLAVVYAPEKRDSQGDIASAEVIKEMAYEYARRGEGIDIRHDGKSIPREQAFIAEQFIIQKGDPRFAETKDYDGNPVDVTGGWGVVMKIDDPALRAKYSKEGWNGVSMGGEGEVEIEKTDTSTDSFLSALLKRLGLINTGDTDMTPEQIAELRKSIVTEVVAAIKPAPTPPTPKAIPAPNIGESLADFTARVSKEDATATSAAVLEAFTKAQTTANRPVKPIFKGDPFKVADVQAHQLAVKRWELSKDVDFDNPESLAKYAEAIAEFDESQGNSSGEPVYKTDLEREQADEIRRLRKASNQGLGQPAGMEGINLDGFGVICTNVSKAENDLYAAGARDGKLVTESRGLGYRQMQPAN